MVPSLFTSTWFTWISLILQASFSLQQVLRMAHWQIQQTHYCHCSVGNTTYFDASPDFRLRREPALQRIAFLCSHDSWDPIWLQSLSSAEPLAPHRQHGRASSEMKHPPLREHTHTHTHTLMLYFYGSKVTLRPKHDSIKLAAGLISWHGQVVFCVGVSPSFSSEDWFKVHSFLMNHFFFVAYESPRCIGGRSAQPALSPSETNDFFYYTVSLVIIPVQASSLSFSVSSFLLLPLLHLFLFFSPCFLSLRFFNVLFVSSSYLLYYSF